MNARPLALLVAAAALAIGPPSFGAEGAAAPSMMKSIAEAGAPSLVTVKFVMKVEGAMGSQEEETETTGVMLDGEGLVLVNNIEMGGMLKMFGMSGRPTDIKVLVGDDTVGVDAKLIARDSELNLAWVRTNDKPAAAYKFTDFEQTAEPQVGDYLYIVGRMSKFFDRAATVHEVRMSGRTTKPQPLLLAGSMDGDMGSPVFDAAGKLVGVTTIVVPNEEDMGDGMNQQAMRQMMAPAVIPAKRVADATTRALETAATNPLPDEEPAEEPKETGEQATPTPAPGGGGGGGGK